MVFLLKMFKLQGDSEKKKKEKFQRYKENIMSNYFLLPVFFSGMENASLLLEKPPDWI